MCRLCMVNRSFYEQYSCHMEHQFEMLEKRMGGDGNGVGAWFPNGSLTTYKGLGVTPAACVEALDNYWWSGAEWMFFHTRLGTCAEPNDENCHPFIEDDTLLCHNGVVHSYSGYYMDGSEVPDSRFFMHICKNYRPDFLYGLYQGSGMFIGMHNNLPYAVKASGTANMTIIKGPEDAVCLISEWSGPLPMDCVSFGMKMGVWSDGTILGLDRLLVDTTPHKKSSWNDHVQYSYTNIAPALYQSLSPSEKSRYTHVTYTTTAGEIVDYYSSCRLANTGETY